MYTFFKFNYQTPELAIFTFEIPNNSVYMYVHGDANGRNSEAIFTNMQVLKCHPYFIML